MKPIILLVGLLLTLLAAVDLNAQKLYTWTDDNGVVHIGDRPPLKTDNIEEVEVIKYKEKTPQEIEAIQRKKQNLRRKFDKEEQIEKARQAEIKAREAEEKAQEAMQQAQEEFDYNNEYIRRLTSTRNKRKKFRKRVDRIKTETEASQAEAQAAAVQAEEEARKARAAFKEAQQK